MGGRCRLSRFEAPCYGAAGGRRAGAAGSVVGGGVRGGIRIGGGVSVGLGVAVAVRTGDGGGGRIGGAGVGDGERVGVGVGLGVGVGDAVCAPTKMMCGPLTACLPSGFVTSTLYSPGRIVVGRRAETVVPLTQTERTASQCVSVALSPTATRAPSAKPLPETIMNTTVPACTREGAKLVISGEPPEPQAAARKEAARTQPPSKARRQHPGLRGPLSIDH